MSNLKQVYQYNENGYFEQVNFAQITEHGLLMPEDCVEAAPGEDQAYWYKINDAKTAWVAEKKPTNAAECVGLIARHKDRDARTVELRQLFEELCGYDNPDYRIARNEDNDLTVELIPPKSFEELKENKLAELKGAASRFEQNVCKTMVITSSLGFPVDADKRSQDNMRGLIDVMSVAKLATVAYRCADDQMRDLSADELKTILVEALTNGQNLYAQKWQFEAAINAAENKEQLDAINIEFVMSDFSNAQS